MLLVGSSFYDSGNVLQVIYPDFAKKLDLQIYEIRVGTQKIDGLKLDIFGIVLAFFLYERQEKKVLLFQKNFIIG